MSHVLDDRRFDYHLNKMLDDGVHVERAGALIAWGLDRVSDGLTKMAQAAAAPSEPMVSMLTPDQVGAGDHVTLLGRHWKVVGTRIVTGSTEFLLTHPEQHDNLLWHYRTTGTDLHMRVRATGTVDDQRPYAELAQSWDDARAAEDFPSEETP